MARTLQRLGALAARRRRPVILGWLSLLALVGVLAVSSGGSFSTEFKIPGTESQRASELIAERNPGTNPDAASGNVVFGAPDGETLDTAPRRSAIAETVQGLKSAPKVAQATNPFAADGVSRDARVAYSSVSFTVNDQELGEVPAEAIERATRPAEQAGLSVDFGGATAPEAKESTSAEAAGVVVALVVLTITFGSLLAAGMPLVTGIFGVAIGLLGLKLATALTDLNDTSQALVTMLGLAVGIDYTLFIVSRHRAQVREGMDVGPSIARAVGTAGSAVVFAGLTVVVALVALAVTGIPFLAQMGVAAAATVAVAVLLSLTFVPALLAAAGERAVRGKVPAPAAEGERTLGGRWVAAVLRHRVLAVLVPVVALTALAIPALDMRTGLPNDGTANPDTTERRAYDQLAEGFGPGFNGPLTVVADLSRAGSPGAAAETIGSELRGLDDVAAVSPARLNRSGDLAIVSVIPGSGPSAAATAELVQDIRSSTDELRDATGAQVRVTGQTATAIDISDRVSDALVPYLAVVIGLALVLLLLAFRSILVPLIAVGGFLLTIGATFGFVTLVFQEGLLAGVFGVAQTGPLLSLLPTLVIGVIFGLAMDYQVFLVSRMRERHVHGARPTQAVDLGFRQGARVVTAAALIMIAVFTGFVIPDDPIVKSIGLAFATGVLLDAFVIRMTLIPALMSLLGERAWWLPRRIDRRLPHVDIEGAALTDPSAEPGRPVVPSGP